MKHFGKMIVGACTVLTLTCTPAQLLAQSLSPSTQWEWNKGTIVIKSPERPAGQESVIGLTVPKMNVVRVGFVGLGMRGPGAGLGSPLPDCQVCHGAWKERSHRSSFGYESGTVLGTYQPV